MGGPMDQGSFRPISCGRTRYSDALLFWENWTAGFGRSHARLRTFSGVSLAAGLLLLGFAIHGI